MKKATHALSDFDDKLLVLETFKKCLVEDGKGSNGKVQYYRYVDDMTDAKIGQLPDLKFKYTASQIGGFRQKRGYSLKPRPGVGGYTTEITRQRITALEKVSEGFRQEFAEITKLNESLKKAVEHLIVDVKRLDSSDAQHLKVMEAFGRDSERYAKQIKDLEDAMTRPSDKPQWHKLGNLVK